MKAIASLVAVLASGCGEPCTTDGIRLSGMLYMRQLCLTCDETIDAVTISDTDLNQRFILPDCSGLDDCTNNSLLDPSTCMVQRHLSCTSRDTTCTESGEFYLTQLENNGGEMVDVLVSNRMTQTIETVGEHTKTEDWRIEIWYLD